jgi:hypothetical protein|tara:strand:+ start:18581 stop:19105 length:525 start_codon:yes stop_codon:yes gene_type:complete
VKENIKLFAKVSTTLFTSILNDEQMNNSIVEQIDLQGDRQKYRTNVKAQMTDWNMIDKPGFNSLVNIICNSVKEISMTKYNIPFNPIINDIWGINYKKNDTTLEHDHWPSTFSCVYYINPPKNCPSLIFSELDFQLKPKHGLLVIFEGWLKHYVPKVDFEGSRYTVSCNVGYHK